MKDRPISLSDLPVARAFSAGAAEYDGLRRRLVPCFDAFYGTALEVIAAWGGPGGGADRPAVLDLGAGTGLFAAMVRTRFPGARMHLVDLSEAMLAQARQRFAEADEVTFEAADYSAAPLGGHQNDSPWDLVISALSIHHLADADKQTLFARIHAALRPGGLFVNAEQVIAPTPELAARDRQLWREAAIALGASEAEIAAAEGRMRFDRCATLADQLAWLAAAGFAQVDCSFKAWQFAVYSGQKPA
ncbi:class I SAM-dependent methyltransferase [Rhodospirillaceae bacterium SYSU D60014]|uniref:class I SAM-dependent methyltransferase n=1 Tax=Virgifigura deserti TaxID=2268457 RepID=UPI000E670A38